MRYGKAPLKVLLLMQKQAGLLTLVEIERLGTAVGMSDRHVRRAVRELLDDTEIEQIGISYRLTD